MALAIRSARSPSSDGPRWRRPRPEPPPPARRARRSRRGRSCRRRRRAPAASRSPRAGGARRFPWSRRPGGAPRAPFAPNGAASRPRRRRRDRLEVGPRRVLVRCEPEVVRGRQRLHLLPGPRPLARKRVNAVGPRRRGRLELEAVLADVAQAVDPDDLACDLAGPAGHARNEGIPVGQPLELPAGLGRYRRILGARHDRREHAVDVEEERGSARVGGQRAERIHPRRVREVLKLLAIGVVAGFFSAVFGVGGGIVIVPLLALLLAFDQRRAAGTSLAAILVSSVAGAVTYGFHGDVKVGAAALVGIPAVFGVLLGTTRAAADPGAASLVWVRVAARRRRGAACSYDDPPRHRDRRARRSTGRALRRRRGHPVRADARARARADAAAC